jgi:hypothetical protein
MEERKNTVKEFWEENKDDIKKEGLRILYTAIGVGVGWFIGRKTMEYRYTTGLGICISVNPDLETEFCKTMDILSERKK